MPTYTEPRINELATQDLWLQTPFGAEGGYNESGDVLVNVTADGVDLNVIWREIQDVLQAWNAERGALTDLLSYWTSDTATAIPQGVSDESFELATEYGEPEGLRTPTSHLLAGLTFEDYDKATRFTWRFLRDSTAEQIKAAANIALAADGRLVQGTILERLFSNVPDVNEWGHTCFSMYNGDTLVPPPYLGKAFTAPHNHFLVSGAAEIDSGDLDTAIKLVTEHGYGMEPNAQLLCLVNPIQAEEISQFKAGEVNNNTAVAKYDYIPSAGSPPWILPNGATIQGSVAPAQFNGLKVQGSYGPALVIMSDFLPEKYMGIAATYGPGSANNCIGVRQHKNTAYQGLRQIPGFVNGYPLQDSFFQRSFGVGVRHRGAACVTKIAASGLYTVPAIPK